MIKTTIRNALISVLLAAMTMPASAQLVSTGDALALESGQLQQRVEAFLLRDEVAAELAQYGISHERAMDRVANLSPAEMEQIAGQIDQMPAGDSALALVGAVFVVLIVLELVGIIDIFQAR